jgi:putative lipoic acid-binding regulatory protein
MDPHVQDHRPSVELLESHHTFPGVFRIKVIGNAADDFEARALAAVHQEVSGVSEVDHSIRNTPGGRHISMTLDVNVQTAEQVRSIYGRLQEVEGLKMLL